MKGGKVASDGDEGWIRDQYIERDQLVDKWMISYFRETEKVKRDGGGD